MSEPLFAYRVSIPGFLGTHWDGSREIDAATPGKAKAAFVRKVKESWDVPYTRLHCRLLGPARPPAPTPVELGQREADAFNRRVPVGTRLHFWTMLKEGDPTGTGEMYHPATVQSSGNAVAWIRGCSGCVSLTHVEVAANG